MSRGKRGMGRTGGYWVGGRGGDDDFNNGSRGKKRLWGCYVTIRAFELVGIQSKEAGYGMN